MEQALGITEYPDALEEIYRNPEQWNADFCNEAQISNLQQSLNLLGTHCADVLEAARRLRQKPACFCWGQIVSTYLSRATLEEANALPMPGEDVHGGALPLLVLLTQIPAAVHEYSRRGFSMDEIRQTLRPYANLIGEVRERTGVVGIGPYFRWLCLYIKCRIFAFDGFEFDVRTLPEGCVILKNRQTGEAVALMDRMTLHKSGMVLGSAGCEAPEDSRTPVFEETGDGFYGCPAIRGKADGPVVYYPKDQWRVALRPGEPVLSVHLPKGSDLSARHLDSAFCRVLEKLRLHYPEVTVRAFHCWSWLLDPVLEEILGPDSKITRFASRFIRFPVKSDGMDVFTFVFPPNITDLNALPENTRLERGLKKQYLSGGYVYDFGGVILL